MYNWELFARVSHISLSVQNIRVDSKETAKTAYFENDYGVV